MKDTKNATSTPSPSSTSSLFGGAGASPAVALALISLVLAAGCTTPSPAAAACSHAAATLATPLDLLACAREAAAAWRGGLELYGVEGVQGAINGTPVANEYRTLDGAAPEWGFTFANLSERASTTIVVLANGSVRDAPRFAWNDSSAPQPHHDGYGSPLAESMLDVARLRGAIVANESTAPYADKQAWHAYSLVSVKDKQPAWFVIVGATPRSLYAEVRPDTWVVIGATYPPA